jgi:hypothetical protein
VSWHNPIDRVIFWLDLLKEMEEKMIKIMQNLKIAKDKKKSYAKKRRSYKDFRVGEHVFLKVKATKSLLKLGICSKLTTRYCGPFVIL